MGFRRLPPMLPAFRLASDLLVTNPVVVRLVAGAGRRRRDLIVRGATLKVRAARCLEHVIDLEPGYGPGYLELARVYARMGDKESNAEMLGLYQKYVRFEQRHDTLQTRARGPKASIADIKAFAELLLEAGDLGRATTEYERIMSRTSTDKEVRARLKRLYARLGRTEQLLALESEP